MDAMRMMKAVKCPTDDLSFSNCAIVNAADFAAERVKHVEVKTGPAHRFVFTVKNHSSVDRGKIAFAVPQRKWAQLSLEQEVGVAPFSLGGAARYVGAVTIEADFYMKKNATTDPLDSDAMAREFTMQFTGMALTVGMQMVFQLQIGDKQRRLALVVKQIEALDLSAATTGDAGASAADGASASKKHIEIGELLPNSVVIFDKSDGSVLSLVGKSKGKQAFRAIINPDWDFQKMGIGGLDTEFSAIFRRAFASRVFPAEFIEQLGMKHVRGILLFGPPGTGKTLMARQIGKMLNAREPKIVNGPQILDKYVGESEANVRKLFAEAEEEWKRCGANSGLHIIIFDEIDAICKARGSMAGATAVHDTVVNQLLAKMDGVDQLNNILVIGMTNRRDMLDEALLRPGRLEVHMEIGLPDEAGRVQIVRIHTARMRDYGKLAADVDVLELARLSKNFSGAEIEGLVRAAQSSAMNRLIKAGGKVEVDADAIERLAITMDDFYYALEHDIKPAFGSAEEVLDRLITGGLTVWGAPVRQLLDDGDHLILQAKSPETRGLVSVLLEGGPNTGKTALAATIAKSSEFPFVKVCSPEDMVGYTETAKCATIKKLFDDAYKSPFSVVLVDNIERLLDYAPIGPRYSNLVLQAILVLLKKQPPPGKRLLILATTSARDVCDDLGITNSFSTVLHVSPLTSGDHVLAALDQVEAFPATQIESLQRHLAGKKCLIGIKKLLDIVDFVRQCAEGQRVTKFLCRLEEDGGLV